MAVAIDSGSVVLEKATEVAGFECVGCGGRRSSRRPVMRADPDVRPFDLFRCADCRLVQQHPRYAADAPASLYDRAYYVFNEPDTLRWARAVQQYVVHILPFESKPPKRLLDLGCGPGHLTALARRRGWRVTGIDISPDVVSRAAVKFGLDFRAGRLARHRSTLPPFDLVFLGDLIEHVLDPCGLLREVRASLSPDGVVCLDTPNWAGIWRRIGRSKWLGLNRYHINLFDAASLSRLLARCGFGTIRTGSYTNCRYESWEARPEIARWLGLLPKAFGWRINRALAWRGRRGRWATLRTAPPDELEEARRRVSELARCGVGRSSKLSGDNLIASAQLE